MANECVCLCKIDFEIEDSNAAIDFLIDQQDDAMDLELANPIIIRPIGEVYEGPTEFTPTQAVQVIQTNQKFIPVDLVINPIPQNYGLITYNGAIITVS